VNCRSKALYRVPCFSEAGTRIKAPRPWGRNSREAGGCCCKQTNFSFRGLDSDGRCQALKKTFAGRREVFLTLRAEEKNSPLAPGHVAFLLVPFPLRAGYQRKGQTMMVCHETLEIEERKMLHTAEIRKDGQGFYISVEFEDCNRYRYSVEHWPTEAKALHALKYGEWTRRSFNAEGTDFVD
jgi:hypothetical protein